MNKSDDKDWNLHDSIAALKFRLSKEEMKEVKSAYEFKTGFLHDFIGYHPNHNWILQEAGHYKWVEPEKNLNAS